MKNKKAFTLVELIIVIAIIAILAAAIFVAVDPARRLNETRNARRSSDVATLLDAVRKHQVDNDGAFYTEVAGATADTNYVIGTSAGDCTGTCGGLTVNASCIDISGIGDNYLAVVPKDPKTGTDSNTAYYFNRASTGSLTVGSCFPEGEGGGGGGTPPTIIIVR